MLKLQQHHYHPPLHSPPFSPHYLSISKLPIKLSLPYKYNAFSSSISSSSFKLESFKVSNVVPSFWGNEEEEESLDDTASGFLDDLAPDSLVYQKTLRLVECSMFAAVSGLTYLLSNSLAIEVRVFFCLLLVLFYSTTYWLVLVCICAMGFSSICVNLIQAIIFFSFVTMFILVIAIQEFESVFSLNSKLNNKNKGVLAITFMAASDGQELFSLRLKSKEY